ncbi:MAG: hypothetical protein ACHQJD_00745 [Thermoanaerobaculia bacterium]
MRQITSETTLEQYPELCVISVSTGRIRELPLQMDGTYFLDYAS